VSDTEARVTVGAEYGIHQEYGTRHQRGTPFIRPTVDGHGQEIVDVVLQHIRNRAGL
jgi:HK97 gp10 family phage protein